MAKTKIEFNNDFIFKFNKISAGSVSDQYVIPKEVFETFKKNYNSFTLRTKQFDDNYLNFSYKPDASSPYYLLEFSLTFERVLCRITPDESSEIFVNLLKIDEHDDCYDFHFKINGTLTFDFKINYYNNIKNDVERRCIWENAPVKLRLNFRNNYILTSKGSIENSLKEILEKTPNVYCSMDKDEYNSKNVILSGKYLLPFS